MTRGAALRLALALAACSGATLDAAPTTEGGSAVPNDEGVARGDAGLDPTSEYPFVLPTGFPRPVGPPPNASTTTTAFLILGR